MVEFSVVMPIKDETELLKYSLPSIYTLEPDEVVLVMEDVENSIKVAKNVAKYCNFSDKTRICVLYEDVPDWNFRQAYARRKGYSLAKNDVILTVDADIIVDVEIKKYFELVSKSSIKLVSFNKIPYPITYKGIMDRLIHKIYKHPSFTGLYVFSKKAWQETEDIEDLKRIPRGEDTHLHAYLTKRYNDLFVSGLKNIVLRPKESSKYQYLMGQNRWKIRRAKLWQMMFSTILYFKPWMMIGYLKARYCEKGYF